MASIDMPLEQLVKYRPKPTARKDFCSFWKRTIEEAREYSLKPELEEVGDYDNPNVSAYSLTFSGFGGHRIKGYYILPKFSKQKKLPIVVIYHGYNGGRGNVEDYAKWLIAGCAVAVMDTRGQSGATGNPLGYSNPSVAGWMTHGILDKNEYYYRAVFTDAVRLLDFVDTRSEIDKNRIAVTGISQGGGITIAVAGLDKRPSIAMPDIPFLCHFKRGVELSPGNPYLEVADYIRRHPFDIERVYETLSYFDGMNLAGCIKAKSLWSVGLWDTCCPPSTIYGAYNNVKAKKEIRVYPYNGHELIGHFQQEKTNFVMNNFKLS